MLIVQQRKEDVFEVDEAVVNLLRIFLFNLLFCVLGDRFLYHPSRILNPGWTVVFG
jgi:hypothetical protein